MFELQINLKTSKVFSHFKFPELVYTRVSQVFEVEGPHILKFFRVNKLVAKHLLIILFSYMKFGAFHLSVVHSMTCLGL